MDGLDLTCARGAVTAVLGPNGAGKTTTVETCEGYRRPDAGHRPGPGPRPGRRRRRAAAPDRRDAPVRRRLLRARAPRRCCATSRRCTPTRWTSAPLIERLGLGSLRPYAPTGGSPAASSSGSPWPWPSSAAPSWSSSTSRPPASTRRPAAPPGTSYGSCAPTASRVVLTTHFMDEAEQLADDVAIIDARPGHRPGQPRGAVPRRRREHPALHRPPRTRPRPRCSRRCPPARAAAELDPGGYRISGKVDPQLLATVTSWCAQHGVMPDRHLGRAPHPGGRLPGTDRQGAARMTAAGTLHPAARRRPAAPHDRRAGGAGDADAAAQRRAAAADRGHPDAAAGAVQRGRHRRHRRGQVRRLPGARRPRARRACPPPSPARPSPPASSAATACSSGSAPHRCPAGG